MSSTARTEIVKTCFILLRVLSDDGRLRQGIFTTKVDKLAHIHTKDTMSIFDLYTWCEASGKYS